jgi:aromatic-L-amino-acid decarboxylase
MAQNGNELELSGDEMRALVDQVMNRIAAHIDTLPQQPASNSEDGARVARDLAESLPEAGAPLDEVLNTVFDEAAPISYNTAGPGYLAYIPGGGVPASAVASLIADSVNRYVGVWLAAPGFVQLEVNVIRWFCEIVGYPADSGGILTTGGSMANFTALVTARRERLPEDFLVGTVYTSAQTHHSVVKAAMLAGLPERNVRTVPTNEHCQMRLGDLTKRIEQDRGKGLQPFLVVGNAGTTNTGAVDDLVGLADLAAREGLWLHLDAAYGGFFMLTERGRQVLRGIERADSITLDPHKGLFLPYGSGSLLMRDPLALRRAHSTFADYMPAMQDDWDLVDFCQLSPELSRDFRGLRAWLPIKLYGIGAFRKNLDEKLDLTEWATEQLRAIPGMQILAEPQLSLVAFRLAPPARSEDQLNDLNERLLAEVNRRKNVYLTATTLDGRFALRICVLSFRTHRDRMEQCLADIRGAALDVTVP